jgi:hypothetical protein
MFSEKLLENSSYNQTISKSIDYKCLPRFRWYGYKEGFSPHLVTEAIKSMDFEDDDFILDPFNGNGTATLTASLNKIEAIGIEVNPFVAFMSRVKLCTQDKNNFLRSIDSILVSSKKQKTSNLLKFSTFSEFSGKSKWLFNSEILNTFEGGWVETKKLSANNLDLFRLALIGAAMDNCNATKDGKCLKYRKNWNELQFSKENFLDSLEARLNIIAIDLEESNISKNATIINEDSRIAIASIPKKFKLCVTSPPYLNSFDYTDIYRPELFLGKFITNNDELRKLRYKTIRSHVEIKLPTPLVNSFGEIYKNSLEIIKCSNHLWDKQIPIMIQSYFEDMENILSSLKLKAKKDAQLWLVVANSIYAEIEMPVDLILAEIGTRKGWKLQRIEVLRNIQRRKTKHNGNLLSVRESLIVFQNN